MAFHLFGRPAQIGMLDGKESVIFRALDPDTVRAHVDAGTLEEMRAHFDTFCQSLPPGNWRASACWSDMRKPPRGYKRAYAKNEFVRVIRAQAALIAA